VNPDEPTPFEALRRIFHEPARLAILSALCAADRGLAFSELKDRCRLTDGNLNRHLAALHAEGVVRIEKKFVGLKPRTTIHLSKVGLRHFREYLDALEDVLRRARKAVPAERRRPAPAPGRPVPA